MAQGTVQYFEEALKYLGDGTIDLDRAGWKIALFTNGGAPTFAPDDVAPAYSATNEVSGTNYTAAGEDASVTWVQSGAVSTFSIDTNIVWSQNGAGPTDIYWGLIYDTNAIGTTNAAVAYIDMGNAANISLQDGDITINAGDIFTLNL